MMETIQNYTLSETFGWTPNEIKELSHDDRLKYISIMGGMTKVNNEK